MMDDAEFRRIDRLLGLVIERPGEFTQFQVDFAMTNAERLELYGRNANFSDRQKRVIDKIEKRVGAIEAGA